MARKIEFDWDSDSVQAFKEKTSDTEVTSDKDIPDVSIRMEPLFNTEQIDYTTMACSGTLIDFINVASTGNAMDFGDLMLSRYGPTARSIGFFGGGRGS